MCRFACGAARLIPAHAGKTRRILTEADATKAHPRSRGENSHARGRVRDPGGSSPLTRGKLDAEGQAAPRGRLIPAHAGKTAITGSRASRMRAHPRSRGENVATTYTVGSRRGSSPLTRGKRGFAGGADEPAGLIPAHAGKTKRRRRTRALTRAHPRSRGENLCS